MKLGNTTTTYFSIKHPTDDRYLHCVKYRCNQDGWYVSSLNWTDQIVSAGKTRQKAEETWEISRKEWEKQAEQFLKTADSYEKDINEYRTNSKTTYGRHLTYLENQIIYCRDRAAIILAYVPLVPRFMKVTKVVDIEEIPA